MSLLTGGKYAQRWILNPQRVAWNRNRFTQVS